jgi:hypothetical protein
MASIDWVRRIYGDGWHNAFTDMVAWRGRHWVCFRNGLTHVSPEGKIVVISSADLHDWSRRAVPINTTGDDRDPTIACSHDRLFLYSGSSYWSGLTSRYDDDGTRILRNWCSHTDDGVTWSEPQQVYREGFWLWRVERFGEEFYALAYGRRGGGSDGEDTEVRLLRSADGLEWEDVSIVGPGNEAAFRMTPAGALEVLIRGADEATSTVAIADPPYQSWQTRPIGDVVPGPNLIEQGDALYAIGRQHLRGADGTIADRRTSIWRIDGRRAHVLDLPSSGDTSYCGVVERDDGTVLISYYSQHEVAYGEKHYTYPDNIYLAQIRL